MEPVRTFVGVTTRLYQRIGAHLILCIAFIFLLYFLGYFLLNSTFATQAFDNLVNREFRGKISWTRVSWGPLPWQIRVLEPVLLDGRGRAVITAKTVTVKDFHILDLFDNRISADGIIIEAPVVRLVERFHPEEKDAMGEPRRVFNIEEMFWTHGPQYEDGEIGNLQLSFSDISIRNALVVLDLENVAIIAHGAQVEDGRLEIPPGKSANLQLGTGFTAVNRAVVRLGTAETVGRIISAPAGQTVDLPLTKLKARQFRFADNAFQVAKLTALLRDDPLRGERLSMNLDTPDLPSFSGRIELNSSDIAKHLLSLPGEAIDQVSGPVNLSAWFAGELDAADGVAIVESPALKCFGVDVADLSATITKDDLNFIRLERFKASIGQGTVRAVGFYHLEEGKVGLDLWPAEVDVSKLGFKLPEIGRYAVAGPIAGAIHLAGSDMLSDSRVIRLITQLETKRTHRSRLGLGPALNVDAISELVGEDLHVESLLIRGAGDTLSVKGRYHLVTQIADLTGQLSLDDILPIASQLDLPIAGSLTAKMRLENHLLKPKFSAEIDGRRIGYPDLPTSDLSGKVGFDRGVLEFDGFRLRSETGSVGLQGIVKLHKRGYPVKVRVNARQFELGSLPLNLGLSGRVALDVDLTGSLVNPVVTGRGRLARPCWQSPHRTSPLCFRRLDTEGQWSKDRFTLKKLTIRNDERVLLDVKGKGRIRNQSFSGSIAVDDMPLDLINHFIPEALPIRGSVQANLELEGTLRKPRGDGRIEFNRVGFGEYNLGDSRLNLEADSQTARITGNVLNTIALEASIPIDPEQLSTATIEFKDLSLEQWLPQLEDVPIESSLGGRATASFFPFKAKLVNGRVDLDELSVRYDYRPDATYTIRGRETATVSIGEREIELARMDIRLGLESAAGDTTQDQEESVIVLGGRADFETGLDLSYRGTLGLDLFEPFLRSVFRQTSGRLSIRGKLNGQPDSLVPTADIVVESAELVPRVSLIGAQLELLEPADFSVRGINSEDGDSLEKTGTFQVKLTANGAESNRLLLLREESKIVSEDVYIRFEDFLPDQIRIGVRGSELGLNIPRVMRGTINTPGMTFEMWNERFPERRSEQRLKLSGRVEVISGEYIADITGTQAINRGFRDRLSGRAQASTISLFERIPSLKRLMLDLSVTGDGDFFLRNEVLTLATNLELRLQLDRIRGFLYPMPRDLPEERLAIEGQVTVLPESKITYARRDFDVSQGVVDFGGLNFLDASVEATRTFTLIRGQSASAASTSFESGSGDIDLEEVVLSAKLVFPTRESPPNFDFQLSSNSGASNFEVAMLVLTGSYPENLSGVASAQPAAEVVLAPLLSLVERPLEDTFNVDLTLTPVSSGTLYIDANKILSRRLRLYSRVLVGEEEEGSPQKFRLEYQINNIAFGQLSNERSGSKVSTSGLLHLRLNLN